MAEISLYECYNAKVRGSVIYCAAGHDLSTMMGGQTQYARLERGEPLVFRVCQHCVDFVRIGEPLKAEDRGWVNKWLDMAQKRHLDRLTRNQQYVIKSLRETGI